MNLSLMVKGSSLLGILVFRRSWNAISISCSCFLRKVFHVSAKSKEENADSYGPGEKILPVAV